MARLPSADQIALPTPQPTYSTPEVKEGNVGNITAQLGNQIDSMSGEIDRAQDHVDTIRAEEAFNKLRDDQLALTQGPEGFSRIKGGAAVNRAKPLAQDYTERFNDRTAQIENGLSNGRQKQKFMQRANVARQQFGSDLLAHAYREGEAYAQDVYQGTVKTESNFAMANWDNPNAVAGSIERIHNSVAAEGKRQGWGQVKTDAVAMGYESQLHREIIGMMVDNDRPAEATSYYEGIKSHLDAGDQMAVQGKLLQAKKQAEIDTLEQLSNNMASDEEAIMKDPGSYVDRRDTLLAKINSLPGIQERNRVKYREHIKERMWTAVWTKRSIDDAQGTADILRGINGIEYKDGVAQPPAQQDGKWGRREDGTLKGDGYFGTIPRKDGSGKVSGELSVGVKLDGKETLIPMMVPTLNAEEMDYLLSGEIEDNNPLTKSIIDKARAHAKGRLAAGRSVWAEPGERYPNPSITDPQTAPFDPAKLPAGTPLSLNEESLAPKSIADQSTARGIRNNNPGNLVKVKGLTRAGEVDGQDSRFASFDTPEAGIAATAHQLQLYQTKYGINTVRGMVSRWAPESDNNDVDAYVAYVSKALGVKPQDQINTSDEETLTKLTTAIIQHENGHVPYSESQINVGIRIANGDEDAPMPPQPNVDESGGVVVTTASDGTKHAISGAVTKTGEGLDAPAPAKAQSQTGYPSIGDPDLDNMPLALRMKLLHQADAMAHQAHAKDGAILAAKVKDFVTMAKTGVDIPIASIPTRDELIKVHGGERGSDLYTQEIVPALQLNADIKHVVPMPRDDQLKLLGSRTPTPGAGYHEALQLQGSLQTAIEHVWRAQDADPAGWTVANAPGVKKAYEAMQAASQSKDPRATKMASEDYANSVLAEQQRIGMGKNAILPNDVAASIVQQFYQQENGGQKAVQLIKGLSDQWGKAWPSVYGQIAKALPGSVRTIGAGMQEGPAMMLAGVADKKTEDLKVGLPTGTDKEINERLSGNWEQARISMVATNTKSGQETFEGMYKDSEKLALLYVATGKSTKEAADQAYKDVIGHKYELVQSGPAYYRVPIGQDSGAVSSGAKAIISDADKLDLMPVRSVAGLNPEQTRAAWASTIKSEGYWVQSPNDDGLNLYVKGAAVQDSKGQPIWRAWYALQQAGSNGIVNRAIAPSAPKPTITSAPVTAPNIGTETNAPLAPERLMTTEGAVNNPPLQPVAAGKVGTVTNAPVAGVTPGKIGTVTNPPVAGATLQSNIGTVTNPPIAGTTQLQGKEVIMHAPGETVLPKPVVKGAPKPAKPSASSAATKGLTFTADAAEKDLRELVKKEAEAGQLAAQARTAGDKKLYDQRTAVLDSFFKERQRLLGVIKAQDPARYNRLMDELNK